MAIIKPIPASILTEESLKCVAFMLTHWEYELNSDAQVIMDAILEQTDGKPPSFPCHGIFVDPWAQPLLERWVAWAFGMAESTGPHTIFNSSVVCVVSLLHDLQLLPARPAPETYRGYRAPGFPLRLSKDYV